MYCLFEFVADSGYFDIILDDNIIVDGKKYILGIANPILGIANPILRNGTDNYKALYCSSFVYDNKVTKNRFTGNLNEIPTFWLELQESNPEYFV